jgi:geranylgeranyl diphosphate synthase type II
MNAGEIKSGIESCLKAQGFDTKRPEHLYAPMAYLLQHEAKRVRPVLAVLAYQYCGGKNPEGMTEAATAIELVHNFTLMHDDIMDHAPTRRGMPTVHEKWDTNIAILSGDALFALAYPLLIRNFPERASELVNFFTKVVVEVCEGQMEDMDLAASLKGGIPEYLEMIRKKTAVLIGGSLAIGGIAAGVERDTVDKLYQAGMLMGIGFQLQDDLLDVYAAQADFGKQVGGDIIENKKTFLLLRALEKADRYRKEALMNWMQHQGDPAEKIAGVVQIFNELEIREEAEAKISGYFQEAQSVLSGLPDHSGRTELLDYLEKVFLRKK